MDKREYDFTGVDEMVRDTFSERLKGIRSKAGLSQAQFADMLGISVAALSYYERGERIPDITFLYKVQECFSIPDGYLLGNTNSLMNEYVDISKKLLLSDEAIKKMQEYIDRSSYFDYDNYTNNILSKLLESDELYSALNLIAWDGFESYNVFPDKEYIDYIATTKLLKVITSIRKELDCSPNSEPISMNQAIQKDYMEWLMKKLERDDFSSEVNKKYTEQQKKSQKQLEARQKEYMGSDRYKAFCKIKEAPDNGSNNPRDK